MTVSDIPAGRWVMHRTRKHTQDRIRACHRELHLVEQRLPTVEEVTAAYHARLRGWTEITPERVAEHLADMRLAVRESAQ